MARLKSGNVRKTLSWEKPALISDRNLGEMLRIYNNGLSIYRGGM